MNLSPAGQQHARDIARRYGVSDDAVRAMLEAVIAGQGRSAQFNIPEFGGMGQWMSGGMIMVGDMFNQRLKDTVGAICSELAGLLSSPELFTAGPSEEGPTASNWWPDGLGIPATAGAQNSLRYAWFPAARRLAIDDGGVTLYDTGDHSIGGVSQQQGDGQILAFRSQHGLVRLSDLPIV